MKVITGHMGFIGKHLVDSTYDPYDSDYSEEFWGWDIKKGKDIRAVKTPLPLETIFHLAACSSIGQCDSDPDLARSTNIDGTINMLELARYTGAKLIFASTAAVYPKENAWYVTSKEDTKLEHMRMSLYARTKFRGEELLKEYAEEHSVDCVALRFFNVYGPGQAINSDYGAVIPRFINAALHNEDIIIHGDGEQSRDFIYVGDVVRTLRDFDCFKMSEAGTGPFNVGSGYSTTINELAKLIVCLIGSKSTIRYDNTVEVGIRNSRADLGLINSVYQKYLDKPYQPSTSMIRGLTNTIEYFKAQMLQDLINA